METNLAILQGKVINITPESVVVETRGTTPDKKQCITCQYPIQYADVFANANNVCVLASIHDDRLQAHHLVPATTDKPWNRFIGTGVLSSVTTVSQGAHNGAFCLFSTPVFTPKGLERRRVRVSFWGRYQKIALSLGFQGPISIMGKVISKTVKGKNQLFVYAERITALS